MGCAPNSSYISSHIGYNLATLSAYSIPLGALYRPELCGF